MKVKELITELKKYHEDNEVEIEAESNEILIWNIRPSKGGEGGIAGRIEV